MSRSSAPDLPELCIQEAVDCHACTATTARELARACPGLPGKLITQLFVQIHTYPACVRMRDNFAEAYNQAMETSREIKKPMAACRPLAAATAA